MTTTEHINQSSTSESTDFVSYIDPELVAIFEKEYGEHFDVVIDMEMKKRTRDIMERHARRYGRTLEQDNSDTAIHGFYFAYNSAPLGYLYGQSLPSHKALEWLTGETTTQEQKIELAKNMAAEINFQGENLIINRTDSTIQDSDNSRHAFAQKRKLETSIVTSKFLDKYTEPEKW